MGAVIPGKIVGLEGQVIKHVLFNEAAGSVRNGHDQLESAVKFAGIRNFHF